MPASSAQRIGCLAHVLLGSTFPMSKLDGLPRYAYRRENPGSRDGADDDGDGDAGEVCADVGEVGMTPDGPSPRTQRSNKAPLKSSRLK